VRVSQFGDGELLRVGFREETKSARKSIFLNRMQNDKRRNKDVTAEYYKW
jgi:hypothetical protein